MSTPRPHWQQDPCPSWCCGEHAEKDHPDDRVHRSAGLAVPVIARTRRSRDGDAQFEITPETYEIGKSRLDGSQETWVYIGTGPGQELEVSLESAHRLTAELVAFLAED